MVALCSVIEHKNGTPQWKKSLGNQACSRLAERTRYQNTRLWSDLNRMGLKMTKFYGQSLEHNDELVTVLKALRKLQVPHSNVIKQIDAELEKHR